MAWTSKAPVPGATWLISLVLGCSAIVADAAARDQTAAERASGWGRYRDRNFGMTFDFPAHVFSLKSAEQGGQDVVFSTPDGRARIRLFALANEANDTPRRYLSRMAKPGEGRFTYVRTTSRFFVASGTRDGTIFYRRCNFSASADHRAACFQMDYPRREKRAWDGVVTRISLSLAAAD
jgi:hypothetical protein